MIEGKCRMWVILIILLRSSPYYILFIALLTGKVSITADARVKNINQDEDSTEIVMKKMKTLIELAASDGGL